MKLTVKVPGSCGELVQGTREGVPFLVTCPVNLYTTVTVTDENMAHRGLGAKAEKALERTLHYLGETSFPYGITLSSELPIGKGMASSSADIAAVCYAVAAVFGHEITAPEVSRIAAGIEPTDGIFFDGVVRLNHMTFTEAGILGHAPYNLRQIMAENLPHRILGTHFLHRLRSPITKKTILSIRKG